MSAAVLEARDITKTYAGVRALSGVSFDLRAGEVHALVGENGAGKSTLIKVLTGAVVPDSGVLMSGGAAVPDMTPSVSRALGIAAIYQQPSLFPHLTVAENIAFAIEPRHPWRLVDWGGRHRRAAVVIDRLGAGLDVDRIVASLSMPEQQVVEIAKAVGAEARVLIMDEPTASLSEREVVRLFEVIGRLRSAGTGIIYISHRLEEIRAVADRVTVLRDGRTMGTHPCAGLSTSTLINLMIGRELSAIFPKRDVPIGGVALELRGLTCAAAGVHDVSLTVRAGEIVGLAGLVGAGRTQLAETVFGLSPADSGEIRVGNRTVRITTPSDAIAAGVGYVPEDRRRHGVVPAMPVNQNISLAGLRSLARAGLIDRSRERALGRTYIDQLRIKTSSGAAEVESLSGGNQQKVALARWLATEPQVLILDEPTQGVDVGSKSEIHDLMQQLAGEGMAVLMISSELPEILGMSDRILVMRAGTVAGELDRASATQDRVMSLALGH